jgi:hypothetical protein
VSTVLEAVTASRSWADLAKAKERLEAARTAAAESWAAQPGAWERLGADGDDVEADRLIWQWGPKRDDALNAASYAEAAQRARRRRPCVRGDGRAAV